MNPAIEIRKEYDILGNELSHKETFNQSKYDHYIELGNTLQKVCTHKDENGNYAWMEIIDGLSICPYCGLTE